MHAPAFPGAVVAVVVQVVDGDRALDGRLPEDEVGVAAGRDHALARIEAGDARRVGGEDLDEAVAKARMLPHHRLTATSRLRGSNVAGFASRARREPREDERHGEHTAHPQARLLLHPARGIGYESAHDPLD